MKKDIESSGDSHKDRAGRWGWVRKVPKYICVLFFIVLFHELGHLVSGLLLGANVKEFAVGFGPSLYSFEYEGVLIHLRAILLGGYVQFEPYREFLLVPSAFGTVVILLAGCVTNIAIYFLTRKWMATFAIVNLSVAAANLIPLPLTDGFRIVELLLSPLDIHPTVLLLASFVLLYLLIAKGKIGLVRI